MNGARSLGAAASSLRALADMFEDLGILVRYALGLDYTGQDWRSGVDGTCRLDPAR